MHNSFIMHCPNFYLLKTRVLKYVTFSLEPLLDNQRPALRLARYIPTIGRGSGTFEGDINVEEILMVSLCSYITANYEWLRVRQFCRHRYSVFLRQRSMLGVRSITFDVLLFSIRRIIRMCPGMCLTRLTPSSSA